MENTDYFKRLVFNSEERRELLEHMRKYMNYKFFPKGTLIHDSSNNLIKIHLLIIRRNCDKFLNHSKGKSNDIRSYTIRSSL